MKESRIVLVRCFGRALFFATALAACAMHRPALAGIVYLNRCVAGCTVSAGPDDAANHVSSILTSNSTAPEFAYSDATFDQVAACVHHVLLPFDIHVVITDPGVVPRREIMLTTTSQTLGFPSGLAENSPYTGNSMANTIAFVFATTLAGNVDKICESAAHDIGILYGLEYVTNCPDIMATNVGCGEKSFANVASACDGTVNGTPGVCIHGNTTQNGFAAMLNSAGQSQSLFINSFEGFEVPHAGPAP